MNIEMAKRVLQVCLVIFVIVNVGVNYKLHRADWEWFWSAFWRHLSTFRFSWAFDILKGAKGYISIYPDTWSWGAGSAVVAGIVLFRYFSRRSADLLRPEHVRGPHLITRKELIKATKREGIGPLNIAGVPVPSDIETTHFMFIGQSGSGKSSAMSPVIAALSKLPVKGIVYDIKGEYVSRFYDPQRDLIFNSLDMRGLHWNILNEVFRTTDIEALAASLIPAVKGTSEEFWNSAATDTLIAVMHYTWQQEGGTKRNMSALWNNISADTSQIVKLIGQIPEGRRALASLGDGRSPQALGIKAKLMQYGKAFEYLQGEGDNAEPFSLTSWLKDGKPGFIFLSSYTDLEATLKPVLSLFIDFYGKRVLSLPDDYNRRLYFMIDEVGSLNRLPSLVQLLAESRSKGGSLWLSTQNISRLDEVYNQNLRGSILTNCISMVFFFCRRQCHCRVPEQNYG